MESTWIFLIFLATASILVPPILFIFWNVIATEYINGNLRLKNISMKNLLSIIVLGIFYTSLGGFYAIQKDKIDLEHGAALVAAGFTIGGTYWVMLGAWVERKELQEINTTRDVNQKIEIMIGFFKGAHRKVVLGGVALLLGFVIQLISVYAGINHI